MKNIKINEITEVLKEIIIRSLEQQIRKNEEDQYKLQIRFRKTEEYNILKIIKKYRRMETGILILGYVEQRIFELEEWIRINDGNFEGIDRIAKMKEFAIELFAYRQMEKCLK